MGCVWARPTVYIFKEKETRWKYTVLDILGGGGFSTVYLVEQNDVPISMKYAIKKMMVHDYEDWSRAIDEIGYHSELTHENILPCINHFFEGIRKTNYIHGTMFMILPYYPRGTLADELQRKEAKSERLATKEVLKIFNGICKGVRAFHTHQPPLAHHDLKPANILLSDDNIPVIMDLGSTGPADFEINGDSTKARKVLDFANTHCTMAYRAPELFYVQSDSVIGLQTDIWSLGCVLFAMCYYKSPFDFVHERGDSIALAVCSGLMTLPDSIYPQDINNLIKNLMQLIPTDRPDIDTVLSKLDAISTNLEL